MTTANTQVSTAAAEEISLWKETADWWAAAVAEGAAEVWPAPYTNRRCLRNARLKLMAVEETL